MAHNKNGAVIWPVFKNLAPGLVAGSFFGAGIAGLLSGAHLQLIIGVCDLGCLHYVCRCKKDRGPE